ncbi:hypothetical protein AVEN_108229-1 [Araneus ventricosus]|uniref:Uncharacterized protein n=1 Tax=Araneus ventricosus TaxID=182803 RepID=A0A4Y2FJA9_ARAVE|nr:hypothetical protein AVEN_108229-1 [Araneus ventricosus]
MRYRETQFWTHFLIGLCQSETSDGTASKQSNIWPTIPFGTSKPQVELSCRRIRDLIRYGRQDSSDTAIGVVIAITGPNPPKRCTYRYRIGVTQPSPLLSASKSENLLIYSVASHTRTGGDPSWGSDRQDLGQAYLNSEPSDSKKDVIQLHSTKSVSTVDLAYSRPEGSSIDQWVESILLGKEMQRVVDLPTL